MNTKYKFDPKMYKTVAKNIKKYRELSDVSITDLSRLSEIKEDFLGKLEKSDEEISISIYDLYKISIILNVSINKFFED